MPGSARENAALGEAGECPRVAPGRDSESNKYKSSKYESNDYQPGESESSEANPDNGEPCDAQFNSPKCNRSQTIKPGSSKPWSNHAQCSNA